MAKVRNATQPESTEVTAEDKELLITVALHNKSVVEKLRAVVVLEDLPASDRGYAELLRFLFTFVERRGRVPFKEELIAGMTKRVTALGDVLTDEDVLIAESVVEKAYESPTARKRYGRNPELEETVLASAKAWVAETAVITLMATLKRGLRTTDNPDEAIAKFSESRARVDTLDTPLIDPLFPTNDWDAEACKPLVSTGVGPWDRFTGGGLAGGEVLLFMGPYGSCKTTSAVQAVGTMARHCAMAVERGEVRKNAKGQPMKPMVVFVSVEASRAEFKRRIAAFLSAIPWKRLQAGGGNTDHLHDNDQPTEDYERAEMEFQRKLTETSEYADANRYLVNPGFSVYASEKKRLKFAIEIINEHVLFVEMLASNEKLRAYGSRGMEDVATIISAQFRARPDLYPHAVVVDHLSALANRQVEKGGISRDHVTEAINDYPRQARDNIAKLYDIPVVLMHQLNVEANKKALNPAAKLHHTDGKGCGSVAEFPDFAIQVSSPTEDSRQLAIMTCSKHRREPPSSGPAIVALNGAFGRLEDRSGELSIEGREIVNRQEIENWGG